MPAVSKRVNFHRPGKDAQAAYRGAGIWFVTLVLALLVVVPPAAGAATEKEQKTAELAQLRARIEALKTDIEKTRGKRDALRDELAGVEKKIGAVAVRLRGIEQKIGVNRKKLADLNQQRTQALGKLDVQRKALARQVRAAYTMGQQQYLKLLLNQQDPGTLGRVMTYYHYLNLARTDRITAIDATLKTLKDLSDRIEQRNAVLQALQNNEQKSKTELETYRDRRGQVLARLNQRYSSQSQEITRLDRNAHHLQRLIEGLSLYMGDLGKDNRLNARFENFKGKLRLPVQAPVADTFGQPREGGALTWEGIFMPAPEGRTVYAVFRGRVAFADWFGGLGMLVILDHGDGYMSLYGHNQALYVEVGDWVETGQAIASVGNSGGLAKPGLYFEIRHNGRPRDPLRWCRAAAAPQT